MAYSPLGFNKEGYRALVITAIQDKTAYFTYSVVDSNDRIYLYGEITKSKVIFYKEEPSRNVKTQLREEIIDEIKSKKSRLYFDFLDIRLEKYPDSLVNTEMFNNYFKPLAGLNFTHLGELHFRDISSRSKLEVRLSILLRLKKKTCPSTKAGFNIYSM